MGGLQFVRVVGAAGLGAVVQGCEKKLSVAFFYVFGSGEKHISLAFFLRFRREKVFDLFFRKTLLSVAFFYVFAEKIFWTPFLRRGAPKKTLALFSFFFYAFLPFLLRFWVITFF